MKILLGLDDSRFSDVALHWVQRMAWPTGTLVIVVSAVSPQVGVYAEVYAGMGSVAEETWRDRMRQHQEIATRAERSLRQSGLASETRVLEGDPRAVLLEIARAEGVDVIVVGSHGHTGWAKVMLGSVANHVVTYAPCSVIVAKTRT